MSESLLTSEQMIFCDNETIQEGVNSSKLMELAGISMAKEIKKRVKPCSTLVICSDKGNGGDGYVVARKLMEFGYKVTVFLVSNNFSDVTREKRNLYKGEIVKVYPDKEYDLIIDSLIGVGLKKNLRENYLTIVNKINESNSYVVSLDIPTGLSANTGKKMPICVISDLTITVQEYKLGLFLADGPDSYKELVKVDIGIKNKFPNSIRFYELKDFYGYYKKRPHNVHKGTYKRSTIIAGSLCASGASMLSYLALTSLLLGNGYSSLATPREIAKKALFVNPEVMLTPLSETKEFTILYNESELDTIIKSSKSIGIGMGLQTSMNTYKAVSYLIRNFKGRLLIDADALNSLSKYGIDVLKEHIGEVVITPHIKEFSRLTNMSVEKVLNERIYLVKNFSDKYNVTVVLKSSSTVVSSNGKLGVTSSGNSGLAKSGSGDTLSGIITGLLANDEKDLFQQCLLGSIILGEASNFALETKNIESMLSTDIIHEIPRVISNIITKSY